MQIIKCRKISDLGNRSNCPLACKAAFSLSFIFNRWASIGISLQPYGLQGISKHANKQTITAFLRHLYCGAKGY
uniref:Uncharacterized protein n=1 Tax=Anguilla anguilla TaxID=7936 RepID=A0A0E9X230_ANGAN